MPSIDMPLEELRHYKPALSQQHDFVSFWKKGLAELRAAPAEASFSRRPMPLRDFEVHEVSFTGFGGATISGELIVPAGARDAPGIVAYHGYSGQHEPVHTLLHWAAMGMVVLSVDTRNQRGATVDMATYPGPRSPGFMTAGIIDPRHYYYRGVYLDCVRALDVLADRAEVDASRLAVTGVSQGGGLSLAAAGLDERVRMCISQVPYLCDFPRATQIAPNRPYREITSYLHSADVAEQAAVFRTLSYFDNVNLAGRIKARTLISVGLWDEACPPSTIFAVYNHLSCEKEIKVYPYMTHTPNTAFVEYAMSELAKTFGL